LWFEASLNKKNKTPVSTSKKFTGMVTHTYNFSYEGSIDRRYEDDLRKKCQTLPKKITKVKKGLVHGSNGPKFKRQY
jgi:hypothetical protein